jgi:spermidine synthase
MRKPSLSLSVIVSLIGFTAVIAQIVLMRELIVVFYGNEVSLGLMLASWLLWTALGSSLLGRIAGWVRKPRRLMAGLQLLISLAFPLTILAVRSSKTVFQPIPGEILGPGPMLLTSLVALSLFCVVSGCLFAAGSRLYADAVGASMATATGSVYLLEAVGSGVGGLLASLLLIRHFTSFEIALFVGLLNLLAASGLVLEKPLRRRAVMAGLVAAFAFLVFPLGSPRLERFSLAHLWQGFHLVTTRNSLYGNLAIVGTEGSRSLYENGLVVSTVPDPAAAEEAVHFALLQHPAPRSLLLLGGGINGSLAQALQHPSLERVDYVELDPAILDLAREYFSPQWLTVSRDPRVQVHPMDGRLFLKTSRQHFDVIIVNLPDPQTAQLNRFYTLEFFQEAAQHLTPGGVFSFQVTGAENYISPELADFLRCINKTLHRVFPEVSVLPGATIHFFAATRTGVLATDAQVLIARLQSRGLKTSYVREYYIPFRMMPDRMLDLQQQIEPQANTPVNHDFAPIAYYFDVALWSSRFHQGYRRWFDAAAQVKFAELIGAAALALFGFVALLRFWPGRKGRPARDGVQRGPFLLRAGAGFCVAAMGFTLIGAEILLLLGFQAIYGYVYHQLAIVIAAFMVGMAWGSWYGLRASARRAHVEDTAAPMRSEMRILAGLQVLAAVLPLLLFLLFDSFLHVRTSLGLFMVSQVIFPALALVVGMLGGYEFPLASRVYFRGSEVSARSPGALYGLDLAGACLGAVILSAYLVPVYGFLKTALLMAVVNLAPAVLAALPVREKPAPQA